MLDELSQNNGTRPDTETSEQNEIGARSVETKSKHRDTSLPLHTHTQNLRIV